MERLQMVQQRTGKLIHSTVQALESKNDLAGIS